MYGWIWRKLPFGLPGKIIGSLLLTGAAAALLWFVAFPKAEPLLPFDDVQVNQDSGQPADGGPAGPGDPSASLDDYDIPYPTHTNNPDPSNSPRR